MTAESAADIVAENESRRSDLFAEYKPHVGVGSPIERTPIEWRVGQHVYMPEAMVDKNPIARAAAEWGVEGVADRYDVEPDQVRAVLFDVRCEHDFEFWCKAAVRIELNARQRKQRDEDIGPLVLNRPQRLYFKKLHDQWTAGRPVRVILLKARQWGGSTLTQCFFAWVQRYHREAWNSFICNLTLDQARHLRNMYERLADYYPEEVGTITLSPYQGSQNIKKIEETDSIVGITSIENPDSPRSYDIHLAHLSEVGLWPSTPKVNAESFAQAVTGAVDKEPQTIVVEESTAKGVGTYFHNHWQDAGAGRSSYEQFFVAWHDIPRYTSPISDAHSFVEGRLRPGRSTGEVPERVERARRLWMQGATLEGLQWYDEKLADFKGSEKQMQQEFPSRPEEAFQSTGQRFFPLTIGERVRSQLTEPDEQGRLVADGETGDEAFRNIEFRSGGDEHLKIWRRPGEKVWYNGTLLTPDEGHVARRFGAFADFGGKTEQADYSCITIADRIKMLAGGPVEVVARLHCHMRPDLFAWASARLAEWYDQALLAYEINRHRKDRGDDVRGFEPEWSLAVIRQVMHEYDNLYFRTVQDRADDKQQLKVGFHTNQSTKPMILNQLERSLDPEHGGQTYYDPDQRFADEIQTFERKDDGRLGAVEGNYDDVVISSAGTSWITLKHMDPPAVIDTPSVGGRHEPAPSQF